MFAVGTRLTVGRSATCDLRLDDPKVSRQHATLDPVENVLVVYDHASLNGTWVNDARISGSGVLRTGDRLRIGASVFVVTDSDDSFHEQRELETALSGGLDR